MRLTSWLASLRRGRRLTRRHADSPRLTRPRGTAAVSPAAEVLEDRTLLSVTTLMIDGELSVVSDAGESIEIGADSGSNVQVTVDGVIDTSVGPFAASSVESLLVRGGDLGNVLDLSQVFSADYAWSDVDGNPMTIEVRGGNGHDELTGASDLGSSLLAGDGNDTITVLGGDVLVEAGDGNDAINGGSGSDTLNGGDGNDSITGGPSGDLIDGGDGLDLIDGEEGDDTLIGGDGEDTIDGSDGNDLINASSGNDHVRGGPGDDVIFGGAGHDLIFGDLENPIVNAGNDTIQGQGGDDTLFGSGGADSLNGNAGADYLESFLTVVETIDPPPVAAVDPGTPEPNPNLDPVAVDDVGVIVRDGRAVIDIYSNDYDPDGRVDIRTITLTSAPNFGTVFNLNDGRVLYTPQPGFIGVETITYTIEDFFGLVSNTATLSVTTVAPDTEGDTLSGGSGNDTIYGDAGPDTVLGGSGNDYINGEPGDDRLRGQSGHDTICGGGGADWMDGATGNDLIQSICQVPVELIGPELFVSDESAIEGMAVDIVMVLDVSGSTSGQFGGSPVGDVNNDGAAEDILDAELAGFIALNDEFIANNVDARIGIVVFALTAAQVDMDATQAGMQLAANPTTDLDGNGVPDVEDILRTIVRGFNGTSQNGTNYEDALINTLDTFTSFNTPPGGGTMIFLSDGDNRNGGPHNDDAQALRALGIDLRAFGVGDGVSANGLDALRIIDPGAQILLTTDQLTQALSGLGVSNDNELIFVVSLSKVSFIPITVEYTTVDGTATAGEDYDLKSGTLLFNPGSLFETVSIDLLNDGLTEGDETLYLQLSNPVNATINDGTGEGTILDDESGATSFSSEYRVSSNRLVRAFDLPTINVPGQAFNGLNPPDTVGDVGLTYYVQMVNSPGGSSFTVYKKSDGSVALGPVTTNSLASSGTCTTSGGDPVVLYDHLADRWLLTEFSRDANALCAYVSQTNDPTAGGWFAYEFSTPDFPDYPKFGIGPDAYYVSTNESSPAVYALDRVSMIAGQAAATPQRFTAPSLAGFGFQALTPADLDGPAAPAGSPGIFMRHRDDEVHNVGSNDPAQDFLEVWEFSVDWANSANSTFTKVVDVPISEFDSDLCGLVSFSCFPQPGSSVTLDPLREVIMHRLQYRNFGTHEALVGNLVTDVDGTDHGGVRWFELRDDGSGWTLFQEGTVAPDADSRWMGAIAMNAAGDIALGYNVSSSTTSPSLRYIGRRASDPAGTMSEGEHTLIAGTGNNASNRWGDYAAMSVDPADNGTFWFTGMYTDGSGSWATRIGSFAFPAVLPPVEPGPGVAEVVDLGDTMLGRSGNDTLVGADGDDLMISGSDRDTLTGGGGDDHQLAGSGDDLLNGDAGDDTLDGQGGADQVFGDDGDDVLVWQHGGGSDNLYGGAGYDVVHARDGDADSGFTVQENLFDLTFQTDARLQLTDGTHTTNVGFSITEVEFQPGDGSDSVTLTDDLTHVPSLLLRVQGGPGNDVLSAAGIDPGVVRLIFDGEEGNDTITGSIGEDTISGGDGDDVVQAGAGRDTVYGGDGDDSLGGGDGDDLIYGGMGFDTLNGDADDDVLFGNEDRDLLIGGTGNDVLSGDADRDTLNGKSGDDSLHGGADTDRLYGGIGNDTLDGGRDNDSLHGNGGDDLLLGDHGDDWLKGGRGDDTLVGGDGNDQIYGERGDDQLGGGDGDDTLNGGRGDDILLGGDGNDTLLAGSGADVALGNRGDDYVKGQGGTRDTIAGGEGVDLVFGLASEIDEAFRVSDALMSELDAV